MTYYAAFYSDGKVVATGDGSSKRVAAQRAVADLIKTHPRIMSNFNDDYNAINLRITKD